MFKHKSQNGFTLIELLVVMSIFAIFAVGGIMTMRSLGSDPALDDAEAVVSRELEGARNRAATGVGSEDHSVYIEEDEITIFEGETYTPGVGERIPLPPSVLSDSSGTLVTFQRISANPSSDAEVVFTHKNGDQRIMNLSASGAILFK